jgi:pyruvate dehydrogenase E1 component
LIWPGRQHTGVGHDREGEHGRDGGERQGGDDIDAEETRDWPESLDSVRRNDGGDRARFPLERLVAGRRRGASSPLGGTTPSINTIPVDQEPPYPDDEAIERRVRTMICWNAMATVLRANEEPSQLGVQIASYRSAAMLSEDQLRRFRQELGENRGFDGAGISLYKPKRAARAGVS